jgi:serine/threonine-protein kinase SMG1
VDIIIGWHLETEQNAKVKHNCSVALQSFHQCWEADPTFTCDLLRQLLEDIEVWHEKLNGGCGDSRVVKLKEFGSFVGKTHFICLKNKDISFSILGVFNTILKCISTNPDVLSYFLKKEFLEESYKKILKVAKFAFNESCDEEVVLSVNEFLLILIECQKCGVKVQMEEIQDILELEFSTLHVFKEVQLASFFSLLLLFIEVYKTTLSVEFIDKLFNPRGNFVTTVRFNKDSRVKCGLMNVYHEVLALKNVPILQVAYKHIVADIGGCLKEIPELNEIECNWPISTANEVPLNTQTSILMAQYSLNFCLSAVSKLSTIQNSIIAMYSLSPSILEVLIGLKIWKPEWNFYELNQYSVLKLISAHCFKNNNFVSSSSLFVNKNLPTQQMSSWLSTSSPTESPVSQHFKLILKFLDNMVRSTTPTLKQMKLIVKWVDKIILQTSQYADVLMDNQHFVFIIKRINNLSINYNDEVLIKVGVCNDSLYAFENIHADIYTSMVELCNVAMCSVNPEIRERFSFILSRIPLRFTLEQAKSPTGINQEAKIKISEMEKWHLSLGAIHGGELRAQYFQEFITHIAFSSNAVNIDQFILRAFKNCWFNGTENAEEYKKVTLKDVRTLTSWIQWESARFCVQNKLRTPLGKPQDTFVKIENIIKEYARILALKDKSTLQNYKKVLANQRNVRILLGFMEALEKAIYNAAEGNAFGIPAPEKPARTFFRLNASTCNEWFSRNRLALHLLALHCMELEMVIRCSTSVLKDMVSAGKTNDAYFEQILMSLVWAYLRNFESDALFGLYTWTKNIAGKKLMWIKFAAEQAAGHREIAGDGYTKLMKDDTIDPQIYDFINDQRKISYVYSGNLNELYTIIVDEVKRDYKPKNIPILTITKEQVACYVKYDKTRDPSVFADLSNWETLETEPRVSNNFSVHNLISLTENTISHSLLQSEYYNEEKQNSSWTILHSLLQECVRTESQEYLIYLNLLNHMSHKATEHRNINGFKNIESFEIEKKFGSITMYLATAWSEFFDDYSQKGEMQNINLRLDLVSCARKQLNYRQCIKELNVLYKKIEYVEHVGLPIEPGTLDSIKDYLVSSEAMEKPKVWTENIARTIYEHCKVLYIAQQQHNEAIQFASSTSFGINNRLSSDQIESSVKLKQQNVKFYMKISEWIQNENEDILMNDKATPLKSLVQSINEEYVDEKMPLIDAAVGKLLQNGAKQCPEMPKIWSALGAWCYRWGRKMVESKTDSHGLRPVDSQAIFELLPEAQAEDIEKILKILNEQHIIVAEDEDIGPNESSSTEMIECQLKLIPLLKDKRSDFLDAIIELWKQAHREVYRYYEMCASSYFKFLLLSAGNFEDLGDSSVITATLRLLRLIVKHALGLQEVLEEGLSKTPSDPWKVIIPQLFSRLNHHEPFVRRRVSELLCRVAKDSPHLIIFPTVVGAQETMDIAKITEKEEKNPEEEWKNSSLTFCFNSLLETLSMQSPETVSQVQLLVRELRRISLLWDELWLLSLTQVYAENAKKFQNFDNEFQKTVQSPEKIILFSEKYRLLMRPALFVLERLQQWTTKSPETNNERNFQERFSKYIENTISDMKKPFDADNTLAAFNKFKSLYQLIQQRVNKRMNFQLKMSDVSPVLANLKRTHISMPGVQPSHEGEAVYIE